MTIEQRLAALEGLFNNQTPQRFPGGMTKASQVSPLDSIMIGVNADGTSKVATVNQIGGIVAAIGSNGYRGPALANTNPGLPTKPEYWSAKAGLSYPNFKDDNGNGIIIPTKIGNDPVLKADLAFNGTSWVAEYSAVAIPLVDYAKTDEIIPVINSVANKASTLSKEFNYLNRGNDELGFFKRLPGTSTYSFENPGSSILPLGFVKKAIKIHSTGNANSFVGQEVPVILKDRTIAGGWFNKKILEVAGVTGFGFYAQALNPAGEVTENGPINLIANQLVKGSEYGYGNYKLKVVELSGDWVYLTMENTGDFIGGTASVVYNYFVDSAATTAAFDFYIGNVTFLKGSDINPFLVYDNAAFVNLDINALQRTKIEAKTAELIISDKTIFNSLDRGNSLKEFWRKPFPEKTTLNFYPINEPVIASGRKNALYIQYANVGNDGWIARDVAVNITERISGGMWVRISDVLATGASSFGYYFQGVSHVGSTNRTLNVPIMLTREQLQTVGYRRSDFAFMETEVLALESGYAYLGFKQLKDFPAGTNYVAINIFASGLAGGNGGYFISGFTCVKANAVNPYVNYNNSGLSKLAGMRITVDGDSIIEAGLIQRAMERMTGCITDFSMSKSGSGYTTNELLSQPPMIAKSRTDAIKNSYPEGIILEGGVNDGRVSAPLGFYTIDETYANPNQVVGTIKKYQHPFTSEQRYYLEKNETNGTANYEHFYPAVYKRLKEVCLGSPMVPIMVVTPMPSYYYAYFEDSNPAKDNPHKPNLNGHYQIDYAHAEMDVCEMMGVPCLNMYGMSGINRYTYKERLGDGIHPGTPDHGEMIAKTWIGFFETLI